jgi:hypothetical protein
MGFVATLAREEAAALRFDRRIAAKLEHGLSQRLE